jgi:DNA polymerase I
MAFKIDFLDDGRVLEWTSTPDGAEASVESGYHPRFHVAPQPTVDDADLDKMAALYEQHPHVVSTTLVEERVGWRHDLEPVLAVDVEHVDHVTRLAQQTREHPDFLVGDLACFNVDFTREFRYCLETDHDPTPASELTTLELSVPITETGGDAYDEIVVADDTYTGDRDAILSAVQSAVDARDPDVLVCSTSELVPTLHEMADAVGMDAFSLSRWPDVNYQQLAGQSTYTSYGRVGHSSARYDVPGRAIVDESNTFFFHEANLDGVLDLVQRSHKPLQEAAWASIGNILTAIQIREARSRDVLVPWNSWRPEFYKSMRTLDAADRGGFIFAPDVGVHEDVHELDFSSLYPNIICEYNVSPDVIRCDCHPEREDVPELGYSTCTDRGYLADVLQPLIDDRDDIKAEIRREAAKDSPDEERIEALEGRSAAIKWILVSCFGYQGFSNAKFGRIECHEAINAYARDILLTAKEQLEAGGWRVVHGIIDSIWVTPDPDVSDDARTPLDEIATTVTDDVGIRLEYEGGYDWVAFVPQRHSQAGALTKYFGKAANDDGFKVRGIEARQRSTPPFIADVQQAAMERLDETRSPDAVIDCVEHAIEDLHAGDVDPSRLVERNRVSKPIEAYSQYTTNVAALERARDQGLNIHPGQDVEYIVVDDNKTSRDRVALAHENPDEFDASYYETLLVRAIESILAPFGWRREDIREALAETRTTDLSRYGAVVDGFEES